MAVLTATADTTDLQSSAEQVANGELWRLFTSGLVVDGVAVPQIALTAAAAFVAIRAVGPAVWWLAVIVGHVGSALLAYAIIGIAIELGSQGADAAADDPDFGISCVLGATLGVLFASGYRVIGIASFVLLIPFSLDWYGPEHPLSFVLGAGVAWFARSRSRARSAACGSAPRTWRGRGSCGA